MKNAPASRRSKSPLHRPLELLEPRLLMTTAPTVTLTASDIVDQPAGTYGIALTFTDPEGITPANVQAGLDELQITRRDGTAPTFTISQVAATSPQTVQAILLVTPPGGTWTGDDAGRYRVSLPANAITDSSGLAVPAGTLGSFYYDPGFYFRGRWYDAANPDVAAAVEAGALASSYEHFVLAGQKEGRSPSPLFDEAGYRRWYPDVADAIEDGRLASGFTHFLEAGRTEGRDPTAIFDSAYYLQKNPDVATALAAGGATSAYDHYLRTGAPELRPASPIFDIGYYVQAYPNVYQAVTVHKTVRSPYEFFLLTGAAAGHAPNAFYNETAYLALNADVAAAVQARTATSGVLHYLATGEREGRRASVYFDPRYYVQQNPAAATAVSTGQHRSLAEHFLSTGLANDLKALPLYDEAYYFGTYPAVQAQVEDGLYVSGLDHFAKQGAAMALNPSNGFDSTWYLNTYQEARDAVFIGSVRSAFEHYFLVGRHKGFQPHA